MKNKDNLIEARAHIQDAWEALNREVPMGAAVHTGNTTRGELLDLRSALGLLALAEDHMDAIIEGVPFVVRTR